MMTKLLQKNSGCFLRKAGKLTVICTLWLFAGLATPTSLPAQTNIPSTLKVATAGGQYRLALRGQPGRIYEIQTSTNLTHWAGITQRATDSNGRLVITNFWTSQTGHF